MAHCAAGHRTGCLSEWYKSETTKFSLTYLVCLGAKQKEVEWDGSDHINKEPAFEVVDGYLSRMTNHFVILIDVRRTEVDEYVNDEHYVDDQIDNSQRIVDVACKRVVLPRFHLQITKTLNRLNSPEYLSK